MTKCFSCSNEAVAIVNSCSPTSSTGVTEPRPRCEECLVNMRGANVLRLLVSPKKFDERMKTLVRNEHGYWVKKEGQAKMTGYCLKGEEQENECQESRERVLEKHDGKLPKKYEHTPLQSCLYCSAFMES